jgi:entericidin B
MMRLVYVVLVTMLVSACNTMSGLGEDIQRGGQKLEDQAEKAKK